MGLTQITTRFIKDAAITLAKLGGLTTKGDLLTYSSTHARLGVGSNGQVLMADSGQTTGLKWASNTPASPLTTKGDLYTYDSADQRLAVGSNGQVLTADSAQATGIKWATPSGGSSGENSAIWVPIKRVSGAGNSTFGTTTRTMALYLGKAKAAYTSAVVGYQRVTGAGVTLTWGEVAIATGALTTNTAANLTTRGFVDETSNFTTGAAGFKSTGTITLSGISAGDDLWVLIGRSGGATNLNLVAQDSQTADGILDGLTQTSNSLRPSTMGAGSTFTLGNAGLINPALFIQFA